MKKGTAIAALMLCMLSNRPGICFSGTPEVHANTDHRSMGVEEAKKMIAARVNGAEITMDLVVRMMNRVSTGQGEERDAGRNSIEKVRDEALRRLIFQELAVQRAVSSGLRVDKTNIEAALSNLRLNLGGDEGYKKFLEHEHVSEADLAAQVERSLLLELVFAKEVYQKVAIPDEELAREYEKNKERFRQSEKVLVTDVVFFMKTDDPESEAKAAKVLDQIKADKDMDPWSLLLDGSFIVRNIELKKERDGAVYEAAVKMEKNGLSGVIKAEDSLHIIKLREYTPERYFSIEEARGSLEGRLRYAAQQKRTKQFEEELRKVASIEIMLPGTTGGSMQ